MADSTINIYLQSSSETAGVKKNKPLSTGGYHQKEKERERERKFSDFSG